MAIEKMSFAKIVAPIAMFDEVSRYCIVGNNFQPEAINEKAHDSQLIPFTEKNPYTPVLNKITDFAARATIKLKYFDFFDLELDANGISDKIDTFVTEYSQSDSRKNELSKKITEDKQIIIQLNRLKSEDVLLDDIFNLEFVKFRFGRIPSENYNKLVNYSDSSEFHYVPTSIEKEYVWGMLFIPSINSRKVDMFFNSLSFERVRISERAHGKPAEALAFFEKEIKESTEELNTLNLNHANFMKNTSKDILIYYSKIRCLNDTFELRRFAIHSDNTFYISGWIPSSDIDNFTKRINELVGVSIVVETAEACPTTPPTKLKNHAIFKPFEDFVRLYGLPDYNEFDPSALIAITYTILFGMMFGDVGHGAILLIGSLIFYFVTKKPMAFIATMVGISAIGFGFLYGSVFGYENVVPGLIHPLEDTNQILIAAVAFGVILISIGMIINVKNGIKQKNIGKALFSPNGVFGIVFYWAVIVGVIVLFQFGKNIFSIWYIIAFVGVPLLLFFLKEPLSHLIETKKGFKPESWVDFIIQNIFELLEVLLSFLTNTISFIRIGAYAMSHAGMMLVVFILARGTGEANNLIVVILGNILVMGLEGMIVAIQALRLEFYEIFSRFYSGEGRAFEPAHIQYDDKKD
ncbi:MAG: V-type ATPase 116kDa subunit family protein [Clostridia bacterium]